MASFDFIKGFLETSFVDWEGHLVSVLFTGGCNLLCPYCQNAPLVNNPGKIDTIPLEKILSFTRARRDWIDGICVTGGEPLLQPELPELLKTFRAEGLKIKLDTNGSLPERLSEIISEGLVDHVAMDLKGPLDERYSRITAVPVEIEKIRGSLSVLKESGLPYELRTTVVPGFVDEPEIKDMLPALNGLSRFVLQNFKPKETLDHSFRKLRSFRPDDLERLAALVRPVVSRLVVRE